MINLFIQTEKQSFLITVATWTSTVLSLVHSSNVCNFSAVLFISLLFYLNFDYVREKVRSVRKFLTVAFWLRIHCFLPMRLQSEPEKRARREQFKKRQNAIRKEKRKEHRRTLNLDKKVNKDKKQRTRFEHQGLFDMSETDRKNIKSSVTSLFIDVEHKIRESFADPELVSFISVKMASVVATIHLLKNEKRPSKILAALTLSISSIMPEITRRAMTGSLNFSASQIAYFKERFGFNPFVSQATFSDDNEDIAWLKKLPDIINNWEATKSSPAFEKLSELISIVATMGFIDGKRLCVSVKGLELFRLGTIRKHADVTDLISAILSTLEYFITGGYEYFLTGNPRRFLFDDEDAIELDDLYEMLLEATPHAKTLNLPIMRVKYKGERILLSDEKYAEYLEKAIDLCKKCKKVTKQPWHRSILQTRLDRMIVWRADYNARRSNGKFRKAPLSIWIYGNSGVGKSSLSQLLIKSLLNYMGVPEDELDRIASINEQDKYDSTITGGVHAYLTDDVMNTKADYLETAPTQKIVDHNNNAPLFANKAEIEGKGVTPHNPKITCYTSNVKIESVARQYSNCTESIRRRMIINLDVRIKPEFCIPNETRMDSAKVIQQFGSDPMPDIWDIVISECSSQSNTGMVELGQNFKPSMLSGHKFNITEVLDYCYKKADQHMANQNVLEEIQSTLVDKMKFCPTCRKVGRMCECNGKMIFPSSETHGVVHMSDSVATLDAMDQLNSLVPDGVYYDEEEHNAHLLDFDKQATISPPPREWYVNDLDLDAPLELQAVHVPLMSILPGMNRRQVVRTFQATFDELVAWLEFMPAIFLNMGDVLIARFFAHNKVRTIYWALWSHIFSEHLRNVAVFCFLVDVLIGSVGFLVLPVTLFYMFFGCLQILLACTAIVLIVKWYRDRMQLLDHIGFSVQRIYRQIKAFNWREAAKWLSVGLVTYKVLSMVRNAMKAKEIVTNIVEQQSALEPESAEEVADRDAKVSDWAKPAWEELHVSHKTRTTTLTQMKANIIKNLYHVTFIAEDGSSNRCDGLVIDGQNLLLPLHVFGTKDALKVTCRLKEGDGLRTIFRGCIGLDMASIIAGVDLVLVNAPFLDPHADIMHYFPDRLTHTHGVGTFLYKEESGFVRDNQVAFKRSERHSGGKGFTYALPYNTFNGLCMGILLGEFDVCCIAGVHLMGAPGTPVGLALNVDRDMIKRLRDGLDDKPCLCAMSNGDFPTQMYGKDIINQSGPIHPNSPLHYLPKYSRITPVGECPGRSSHTTSRVKKTIISDLVEEVCGVPCKWGPPKFNRNRMWQASMQYSANTSVGFDTRIIAWAMNDYQEDLVKAFTNPAHVTWIKAEFKPLNSMEVMAGRDGARFIDALPKNTSKGFPLSGPKEEWIERLDPDAFEEFQCPVAIRQEVHDRAEEMCEKFRKGERAYAIFKACVKDEPTSLAKDKVRVFQASDWAFQLLVRKYFLPLARLMSLFPLQSECAVGINAHGPEWDEYAKHMRKYGEDRILAGDYGKFDLRMPAQILMSTYKVFINVCKICGTYTEDDLTIMRGIATEISYSVVAYNGDMIIHNGSHPSGNNMTVYGNCGGNSLKLRCGYAHNGLKNGYTLKTLPKFKAVCAVGTYGDDVKGSVKKGFDWFNHITYAEYMRQNDIVFTMPDKESTPTKYMNDADADFLKRKNVYNPETGLIHGALDEDSIFKSLHTVLQSNISNKAHAAGNIETALREWFHHGRDVFEKRHKQMIQIAERAELQNLMMDVNEETGVVMNSLYDDYDVRLANFKARHLEK